MKIKLFKIFNVLLLTILGFVIFSTLNVNALSNSGVAYFMSTQPGADASTQIGVHYQSSFGNTYIMLTKKDDADFNNAVKHEVVSTLLDYTSVPAKDGTAINLLGFQDVGYECELNLVDLEPGTDYIYYVTNGTDKSQVMNFRTAAGGNQTYTFGYVNDTQYWGAAAENNARYNDMNKMYDNMLSAASSAGKNLDMLFGGGDMVENGGNGDHWNMFFGHSIFSKTLYSGIAGNHEYTGTASSQTVDGRFHASMFNHPRNGTPDAYTETTFYFIYNDTLFISLASSGGARQSQIAWMEQVILNNPTKWIIASVHYPVNSDGTDNAKEFIPTFDKYGVDLVLYGHEHNFVHQSNYYNRKAVGSSQSGTTYQQMDSGEEARYNVNRANYALITVSKDTIIVTCYNYTNAVVKSYILNSRRPSSSEIQDFDKDEFANNFKVTADELDRTKAVVSWDESAYANIKTIQLKDEENKVIASTTVSSTRFRTLSITGLTKDKQYNLNVVLTDYDDEVTEFPYVLSTAIDSYADFTDVKQTYTKGSGLRFDFAVKYHAEIASAKVLLNGEFNQDLKLIRTSFTIKDADLSNDGEDEIKIIGVTRGGEEVVLYETTYNKNTKQTFTISYNLDGGTCENLVESFEEGQKITLPNPTKEGYDFLGWYEGDVKVTSITDKNYQLIAKWEVVTEELPVEEPPVEEPPVNNCKNAFVVFYSAISLLGLFFIRKKW